MRVCSVHDQLNFNHCPMTPNHSMLERGKGRKTPALCDTSQPSILVNTLPLKIIQDQVKSTPIKISCPGYSITLPLQCNTKLSIINLNNISCPDNHIHSFSKTNTWSCKLIPK